MLYLVGKTQNNEYILIDSESLEKNLVTSEWVRSNLMRIANYVPRYTTDVIVVRADDVQGFFEQTSIRYSSINYHSDDLIVLLDNHKVVILFKGYRHEIEFSAYHAVINGINCPYVYASNSRYIYRDNNDTVILNMHLEDYKICSDGWIYYPQMHKKYQGTEMNIKTFIRNELLK